MDVARRFADNLARCRERADITQEELGLRAGVHRTQVGRLERAERMPRIDTLVKLADALSVSPADLMEGIE